jgi:hypothetical protein
MNEEWRPIPAYEGLYEVSNLGRVKSLRRTVKRGISYNTVPERILKPFPHRDGYELVKLCKNSNEKTVKVHRLVAESFLNNPRDLPEVNHKDENKGNNNSDNLEWCTRCYNNNYGTRKERIYSHPNYKNNIVALGKSRRKKVKGVSLKTGEVKIYQSTLETEKDGFNNACISRVCLGKRKTHKGFVWEYI